MICFGCFYVYIRPAAIFVVIDRSPNMFGKNQTEPNRMFGQRLVPIARVARVLPVPRVYSKSSKNRKSSARRDSITSSASSSESSGIFNLGNIIDDMLMSSDPGMHRVKGGPAGTRSRAAKRFALLVLCSIYRNQNYIIRDVDDEGAVPDLVVLVTGPCPVSYTHLTLPTKA